MKSLCKTLAYVELILGIIGSIVLANTFGVKVNYKLSELERDGVMTFAIFLASALCVVTLWAILCAISEILENQEKLLMLSDKNNNPKLDTAATVPICGSPAAPDLNHSPSQQETLLNKIQLTSNNVHNTDWNNYSVWKCPNCKRTNDSTASICMCGTSRPE